MYLQDIISEDFVLLQSDWTVAQALPLVERLQPSRVIVHRFEQSQEFYYLFTYQEAHTQLTWWQPEATVHQALNLHEYTSTPPYSAFGDAATAPNRGVVVEDRRVLGYFDAAEAPASSVVRSTEPEMSQPPGTYSPQPPPPPPAAAGGERDRASGQPVTRQLLADFPQQVALQETVSLLVSLSALSGGGTAAMPLALPLGSEIQVVVQPKRGFVLVGKGEGALSITDEEETLPLQFSLTAAAVGPGKIRVLAFHQGQALGALTLAPTVVEASQTIDRTRSSHEQPMARLSVHQPDLSLLILEQEESGKPTLTFRLTALDPGLGLNLKRFGLVQLQLDPVAYFGDLFKDIEGLPAETLNNPALIEDRLATKGSLLFEKLIPPDLQALLWSLKERIQSVQVQSEEAWIPWEICKLAGIENGRVVEGPFMCEAFAFTRWLPEIGFKPTLKLLNMAVVTPSDSGLPHALKEARFMEGLAGGLRKVKRIPATTLEVKAAMKSGEYDAWHFTGHGAARSADPNRSLMYLENRETMMPEDISGQVRNLGLANPLVFLNACQIGRGGLSLTGVGGWAAQFLNAGAAAFVGALWSIRDETARLFAEEFYNQLLAGQALGVTAQKARRKVRQAGDPAWLAYTVYADPMAMIES